jgi:zinc/manganese transport system permease protein
MFYILFAAMVTVSVQLVGVYLVFASLILPALASHRYPANRQVLAGYVTAAAGYLTGIPLSAAFDLPTGTVVVFTLAATALVIGTFAKR